MRQRDRSDTDGHDGAVLAPQRDLPALDPADYARGHALFEARSDQRARIVDWLDAQLTRRPASRPLSVLSVGCGPGTVDAALAARAVARGSAGAGLRWTGVDPHAPSADAFVLAVAGAAPAAVVTAAACTFDAFTVPATESARYDVITFVHSLYYVPDVAAALGQAVGMLAPGGVLLILHAPLGALNALVAALAPESDGHPQWWSETVAEELGDMAVLTTTEALDACVDLVGCELADRALLDFTVQAAVTDDLRPGVLAALRAAALPGPGLRLPHPVTAFTVRPIG